MILLFVLSRGDRRCFTFNFTIHLPTYSQAMEAIINEEQTFHNILYISVALRAHFCAILRSEKVL